MEGVQTLTFQPLFMLKYLLLLLSMTFWPLDGNFVAVGVYRTEVKPRFYV